MRALSERELFGSYGMVAEVYQATGWDGDSLRRHSLLFSTRLEPKKTK